MMYQSYVRQIFSNDGAMILWSWIMFLKTGYCIPSWFDRVPAISVARQLIATDLIGRGLDVQQVTLVINYDVPVSRE